MYNKWYVTYSDGDLMHHGVKNQRWGVRKQKATISPNNRKGGGSSLSGKRKSGVNSKYTSVTNQAIMSGAVTKDDIELMNDEFYSFENGEIEEIAGPIIEKFYKYLNALSPDARKDKMEFFSNAVPKAYKKLMEGYSSNRNENGRMQYQKNRGQKTTKGWG